VVLAGFPNAGKSTLLNAILRREAAIAMAAPGTTRDPVRGVTVHQGRRIEWVDLAGTRSAEALTPGEGAAVAEASAAAPAAGPGDVGEKVGEVFGAADGDEVIWRIVRRLSKIEVEAADVVLWVMDPLVDVEASLAESLRLSGKPLIRVVQKSDLLADAGHASGGRFAANGPVHLVSAHHNVGLAELIDAVQAAGSGRGDGARGEPPRFLVSAHQQAALDAADEAMARAREAIDALGYEFVAADMRDVLRALEDLTGRVTNDAILDHVFSRFCIGK
jgi:tRNA modification GTPase